LDFFSQQDSARRRTRWLLLAFGVAVLLVVAILSTVVMLALGTNPADNPELAFLAVLFWFALILLASLYRSVGLRDGGGVVARSMGATPVMHDTREPGLRRLRNVVEEMAIASGVPVPGVYVLENERGINAFAAGHSPASAAVTVTRGAIDDLQRDELQGVVAHEFSHILNGDMRLNIRVMGWLYGLVVIGLIGRFLTHVAARGNRRGNALVLVGIAMRVLGYFGATSGRLIQAAVCRSRERLADASAVQFTRDPSGLKQALLKIMGLERGSRLSDQGLGEVAHMLFAAGYPQLLATHPPLAARVRALDPSVRASDLPQLASDAVREIKAGRAAAASVATAAVVAGLRGAVAAAPEQIAARVGNPETLHVEEARRLRLALPEALRACVGGAAEARCHVLGLLLSREANTRDAQIRAIASSLGATLTQGLPAAISLVAQLPPMLRLPAAQHLLPVLQRLPRLDRIELIALIGELSTVDQKIEVFEFCLGRLVAAVLLHDDAPGATSGNRGLGTMFRPAGVLFAVLAHSGHPDDAAAAERAYLAGISRVLPRRQPPLDVPADWPRALATALDQLNALNPIAKRSLVEGLVVTIAHDSQLSVEEAELLRTVCALLQCPLPPLLPAVEGRP